MAFIHHSNNPPSNNELEAHHCESFGPTYRRKFSFRIRLPLLSDCPYAMFENTRYSIFVREASKPRLQRVKIAGCVQISVFNERFLQNGLPSANDPYNLIRIPKT